ncbi:MAG: Tol-Pal system protein TolB, partial [Proteobacteria bacterium]|nr:Tol-Pal system protein TolB [Pseudomonadota bacterium]
MFSIFRMIKKFVGIIFFAIVMSYGVVSAQVEIEIIASEGKKIPITVLPFEGEGDQAKRISEIILSDLTKTGIFAIQSVDSSWSRLKLDDDADYTNWASRAVQNLVVGNFVKLDDGRLQAAFWLYDIPGQAMSVGYQIKDDPKQLHQMAHHFADLIYEKLTGDRGIFSTKIAYVVKKKDQSVLVVADFDGDNPNEIFVSKEPILSPRWAPDGGRIAFVSFLERKAAVYIVPVNYKKKLANGKPRVLGPFLGSNSAPAWSPDGQSMAMAIAKDGGSHIFVVSLKDQSLVQITNSRSINTEPSFSSDGKSLVFTSDRTNRPQVYRVPVSGGTE